MSDTPQLLALMQKTREMKAYDCVKEFESLARKLEKENIALRADKERLDYMEKNVDFVSWMYYGKPHSWDFRGKIDAKRKEAQP